MPQCRLSRLRTEDLRCGRGARKRGVAAALVTALCCVLVCDYGAAQSSAATSEPANQAAASPVQPPPGPATPALALPDSPHTATLQQRPAQTPHEKEAARIAALGSINGRPYDQPSHKDQFFDYLRDSYGLPALARVSVRTFYEEALDKPSGWGQDFPGFAQRFGSNAAITAINGNVRFAMETIFSEDMKYIPCHGCTVKQKIVNTLLAEVTARHDVDGHRFFTLTPVISDFSGPIIANATWYPNHDPMGGVVASRTVFATRIGAHLFTEFVLERRHHDPKLDD
jgi:hypothetical protein